MKKAIKRSIAWTVIVISAIVATVLIPWIWGALLFAWSVNVVLED